MKRLLAFLALCLPIYLFAQGFGSFSHDQPYFAKDRVTSFTPSGSISNISQWWFAGDLTNGAITYWDDRVSGFRATNTTGVSLPQKDTNGVRFVSQNGFLGISGETLTAPNVLNSQSNWMITVIYRPYSTFNGTVGAYTEMISRVSPALDMQADYLNSTVQPRLRLNATLISSEYNNSGWQTVILVNSNSPNQGCNIYTNGVLSSVTSTQYFSGIDEFGRANLDSGNSEIGELSIQEIWIHTNVIDMTSFLSPIQTYVSNNYPSQNLSHTNADVEFVTGETLGTTFNNFTGRIGYYFVPYYNMVITELGRWDNATDSQAHTLSIRQKWNDTEIASVGITCTGSVDYKYGSISPLTLEAHREYVFQSSEVSGGDLIHDRTTTWMTNYYTEGIIRGYVINDTGTAVTPSQGWGPLNFKYH